VKLETEVTSTDDKFEHRETDRSPSKAARFAAASLATTRTRRRVRQRVPARPRRSGSSEPPGSWNPATAADVQASPRSQNRTCPVESH
jgi:hypothetical protein